MCFSSFFTKYSFLISRLFFLEFPEYWYTDGIKCIKTRPVSALLFVDSFRKDFYRLIVSSKRTQARFYSNKSVTHVFTHNIGEKIYTCHSTIKFSCHFNIFQCSLAFNLSEKFVRQGFLLAKKTQKCQKRKNYLDNPYFFRL